MRRLPGEQDLKGGPQQAGTGRELPSLSSASETCVAQRSAGPDLILNILAVYLTWAFLHEFSFL